MLVMQFFNIDIAAFQIYDSVVIRLDIGGPCRARTYDPLIKSRILR